MNSFGSRTDLWAPREGKTSLELIVTCSPGLETLLAEELSELKVKVLSDLTRVRDAANLRIEADTEGKIASKIITHSRLASRVLLPLRSFTALHADMLYDQVRRIPWEHLFSSIDHTVAIFVHGLGSEDLKPSFAALKIKDAICDEVRKHGLERPNVDRARPTVRLEVVLHQGKCEISLDLSGPDVLHRRGWREESGEAPLRENRAAALVRICEAEKFDCIVDPFVGSGTLLIEAVQRRLGIAPSVLWAASDFSLCQLNPKWGAVLVQELRQAQNNAKEILSRPNAQLKFIGRDIKNSILEECAANIERAGLHRWIKLERQDALTGSVPEKCLIIGNPPWGERLFEQEKAVEIVAKLSSHLKHNAKGCRLGLVLGEDTESIGSAPSLTKAVGLRPRKKIKLTAGELKLNLWSLDLF